MQNDRQLWDDFRHGEKNALSCIYYQHIRFLYNYGRKFSPDDEFVKDVIQDLFFDLIRTREKLGATDNIRFYLIKSLRRRIIKELSRSKNLLDKKISEEIIIPDIVYSYERELIDREDLSRKEQMVQKGLSELNSRQREILFYRYSCDFEYEQICEIMSMPYDAARKMVSRALKSLKEHLTEFNFVFLSLNFSRVLNFGKNFPQS